MVNDLRKQLGCWPNVCYSMQLRSGRARVATGMNDAYDSNNEQGGGRTV